MTENSQPLTLEIRVGNVTRSAYGIRYTITSKNARFGVVEVGATGVTQVRNEFDEPLAVGSPGALLMRAAVKAYLAWEHANF